VLEFVCYLLALVFALVGVLAPQLSPAFDRLRLLSAAFACLVLPLLVHAAERV
jgi:hypothetical protein